MYRKEGKGKENISERGEREGGLVARDGYREGKKRYRYGKVGEEKDN